MLQPPAAQPRRRQWRCRERALLVALLVLLAHTADAATDTASLPHVDDCGFCASCVVDTSVPEGMPLPIDPATAATTTPQLLKRQQLLTVPSSGATSPSVAAQRRALTQERWAGAAASGSNQLRRAGVSSARTQTSTSSSSSFSSSFSSSRRRRRAPDGTRRSQPTNLGHLFATAAASHPSSSTTTTTRLESGRGSFESWPPAIPRITEAGQLGPEGEVARLALRPMGRLARRAPLLPNCTACRGCNARLQDISSQVLEFAPRVRFMHRQGDSATWTMFAFPHTSNRRYVVKVFCVPLRKADALGQGLGAGSLLGQQLPRATGTAAAGGGGGGGGAGVPQAPGAPPPRCGLRTYEARVRSLLAQQQVMGMCGAADLSPKVWLAPLKAILPGVGLPVSAWALWQEEARGITAQGLARARVDALTVDLLGRRLNRTQVLVAGLLDVLTAQCDRHAENIFIGHDGQLQVIDNDKALGAVPGCGYDSLLVPGSRYHTFLRYGGSDSQLLQWYKRHARDAGVCHGPIYPHFVLDYRCGVVPSSPSPSTSAEERQPPLVGTAYPAPLARCLSRLAASNVSGLMATLGLTHPLQAQVLHQRVQDLSERGLEWTLRHGWPTNAPRFQQPVQPPCCNLTRVRGGALSCATCWRPVAPQLALA